MSKVHITLVGGQTMPVYLGIKYCSPDKIYFVYSKDSEKQKQRIKNEYKNITLKSDPLDPVDMEQIEAVAKNLAVKFSNDEVILNISGGTKAWSYYFSKIFENLSNARIIYVDQNNIVHNLKSKTSEKVGFDFMMQFKLNKNPLLSYKDFNEYTLLDLDSIEKIEDIRKFDIGIFTNLTNLDKVKTNNLQNQLSGSFSYNNAKVTWKKPNFVSYEIIKKEEKKAVEICAPNVFDYFFNAGWFELKVADILSKWEKSKHIYMNCKFLINKDGINIKQAEKTPKNEVDIIIDTGDKALFVECKTHIANSTDIEKFNSVVKNYGGNGSKSLFVCLNKFGDKEQEKIRDYNMMSYSFSNTPDVNELYAMLDRNIFGINK